MMGGSESTIILVMDMSNCGGASAISKAVRSIFFLALMQGSHERGKG